MATPPSGSADVRTRLRIPTDQLTTQIDPRDLGYASTREVSSLDGMIGQDRGLRALEFGIDIDGPGFNIYLAGAPGSGRNTTLANYLQRAAAARPVPND